MTDPSAPSGTGDVVVVTGGASGIGAGVAELLARRGAYVALADIDGAGAAAGAAAIREAGHRAHAIEVDVADAAARARLFDELRARDQLAVGLVNCAGVAVRAAFDDLTEADWQRVLSINLTGTMAMSQQFARALRAAGRTGAVVNTTSVMAHFAAPNLAAYVASKGGVAMLTRACALELAPHGIRVNAVSPGYIETAMTRRGFAVERFGRAVLARTPMGRFGTPEDVARVVSFLLGEDARYVTGQVLGVDGGMTAGDASLASPSASELDAVEPLGSRSGS